MLVLKLEIHSAVTGQTTEIGRCVIIHDEEVSDPEIGNYDVLVSSNAHSTNGALARNGSVKNYPRRRLNVWRLVLRALKSAFPEERSFETALCEAVDGAMSRATGTEWLGKPVVILEQDAWAHLVAERRKEEKSE